MEQTKTFLQWLQYLELSAEYDRLTKKELNSRFFSDTYKAISTKRYIAQAANKMYLDSL